MQYKRHLKKCTNIQNHAKVFSTLHQIPPAESSRSRTPVTGRIDPTEHLSTT